MCARKPAEAEDGVGDGLQGTRFGIEDGEAGFFNRFDGCVARSALPENDDIRFQADDAFDIQIIGITDAGNGFGLLRIIAEPDGADDTLTGTGGEQQFRDVRRKADDALRRPVKPDLAAAVVGERQCCRTITGRRRNDERQQDEANWSERDRFPPPAARVPAAGAVSVWGRHPR